MGASFLKKTLDEFIEDLTVGGAVLLGVVILVAVYMAG